MFVAEAVEGRAKVLSHPVHLLHIMNEISRTASARFHQTIYCNHHKAFGNKTLFRAVFVGYVSILADWASKKYCRCFLSVFIL